ncbi:hypothetical protein AAG906_000795 [Vitis piasezkii]
MNERDCRQRRCTAVGRCLRLSTPSSLDVRFHFELFSQFVFAKVFSRDLGCCFKDCLGSHKAYVLFLEHKRCNQSAPQSHLTGKGVRLSGVAFYFLRLKAFWPRLALRRARETPLKTLVLRGFSIEVSEKMKNLEKKKKFCFRYNARK